MNLTGLLMGALALGSLVLAGCATTSGDAPTQADQLVERVFESTSVRPGESARALVDGSTIVLTFRADGIAVNAGCNAMSGPATVADGVIDMRGPMAMTMMACEQPLMDQDAWLADFFAARPTWRLDGTTLTLAADGTEITMDESTEYVAQPEPTDIASLVGRTFTSVDTERTLAPGTRIELVFEPGLLSARAGCNTLRAPYSLDGATLLVGEIASTRMACEPALAEQDVWLTAFLDRDPNWSMAAGDLTLTSGGERITFTSGA